MLDILKIEGKIYEVRDGQIEKIKFGEQIFVPLMKTAKKEFVQTKLDDFYDTANTAEVVGTAEAIKTEPVLTPRYGLSTRGRKISQVGNVPIYEKIVEDIKESGKTGTKNIISIIKKYYPNGTKNTLKTYASIHNKYVREMKGDLEHGMTTKGKFLAYFNGTTIYEYVLEDIRTAMHKGSTQDELAGIIQKYYVGVKESTARRYLGSYKTYVFEKPGMSSVVPKKKKRKRRRKPSKACIGFDNTYHVWIRHAEVESAKRAVRMVKFGYIPTLDNIANEMKTSAQRLRAILHYMLDHKIVTKKYLENHTVVYSLSE